MAINLRTDWHRLEIYTVEEAMEQGFGHDDTELARHTAFLDETILFLVRPDQVNWMLRVVKIGHEDDLFNEELDRLFPLDAPFTEPEDLVEVIKHGGIEHVDLEQPRL